MNRKVYINPKQYNVIKESEWNFHFGNEHNGKPYISDNKYQMAGRETGHFGSGTYFSTYSQMKDVGEYGELNKNQNPNFIEIRDHIYRVDFDLYKNLYRVRSKRQGDILYTMMTNLNHMYYKITENGYFISGKARYDNSGLYQEIRANADALGLRCPSYYELTRMAQRHDGKQSFSTLFMEWNGYNGVNVSGVEYYDNTKHGSVIYDLSKVNTDMEEVSPNSLYTSERDSSYNDTVAYDEISNYRVAALRGKDLFWPSKLNSMPMGEALRVLKNYTDSGKVLDPFTLGKLDDDLLSRYLRLIFSKNSSNRWGDRVCDEVLSGSQSRYYIELIERVNGYYWANYESRKSSGLIVLLRSFDRNLDWGLDSSQKMKLKEEYLEKLKGYMSRPLNEIEEEYIKDDYFYDWRSDVE